MEDNRLQRREREDERKSWCALNVFVSALCRC